MATSTERPTGPEDKLAYVAFVGLRPAAIAVAVLTLGDRVQQVRLIVATKEARPIFNRLRTFLTTKRRGLDVQQLSCPDVLRAHESLAQWMGGLRNMRVAFHVDPGLGFGVANLVRHLRKGALLVSTPDQELIEVEVDSGGQRKTKGLIDLGIKGLLGLHELRWTADTARQDRWGVLAHGMVSNLNLPGETAQLHFVRAEEKNGRLYGLSFVTDGEKAAESVRQIESRQVAKILNNLRPEVTICSDSDAALAEALSAGLSIIRPADVGRRPQADAVWTQGTLELPVGPVPGQGGNSPPLAVWLGRDPSATLSALFTHKPTKALVLVDQETKEVAEVASRLLANAQQLPVGTVEFFKTPFDGHLPPEVIAAIAPPAIFNVSPGTRLQVCSVVAQTNADLWSLDQQNDRARCLTSGNPAIPLLPVPLLTQVHVACGVMENGDGDKPTEIPNHPFLLQLGRFLDNAQLDLGHALDLHDLRTADVSGMSVNNVTLDELFVAIPGYAGKVRYRTTGQWLEDLTAVCLVESAKLGEMELELRVGVRLAHGARTYASFPSLSGSDRTEFDVMVRLGRDFFLFDAKAGDITVAKQRAGAVARALMVGRFCVPVAVRPFLTAEHRNAYKTPPSGAAAFDLAGLLDTPDLIVRLQKMLEKRRRTLPEDA